MRHFVSIMVCILLMFVITGCGVKFANDALNKNLPNDLANRTLYPHTEIFKYHLDQLVGSIVYYDKNNKMQRLDRVVKDGYTPNVQIVDEKDAVIYQSKINSNASAKGSYLAFAANIDAKQAADLTIKDVSHIFINDSDAPHQLLDVARKYGKDPKMDLYWIQGLLLSTRSLEYYQEISSNASGVVGNTVGIDGKVFNSKGITSKDYEIALELVDLKQYLNIFDKNSKTSDFPLYKDILKVKAPLKVESIEDIKQ